jgi:hypothetical protein
MGTPLPGRDKSGPYTPPLITRKDAEPSEGFSIPGIYGYDMQNSEKIEIFGVGFGK